MNRSYVFPSVIDNILLYDANLDMVRHYYKDSIGVLSHLIGYFFNGEKAFLTLEDKTVYNDATCFKILASNLKQKQEKLEIMMTYDTIIIKYKDEVYTFNYTRSGKNYVAYLTKYDYYTKNKHILEEVKNHTVYLSVYIENKKYEFVIPYDIDAFLDVDVFRTINASSDIFTLRKMYYNRFLNGQTDYEKSISSYVRVFLLNGEEEVLVDELEFRDGLVLNYSLSNVVGNTIMSIHGGKTKEKEFVIKNLSSEEIDLNKMARVLNIEAQKLDF